MAKQINNNMIDPDQFLLEKAYLSISKAISPVQSLDLDDDSNSSPNEEEEQIVSAGPADEPAPGVDVEMVSDDLPDTEDSVDVEPSLDQIETNSAESSVECSCEDDKAEEEREEDEMAIDNLNSIRESIMKVASFCATGGHLEAWQQQKLAIAMDNLAGIARSLR